MNYASQAQETSTYFYMRARNYVTQVLEAESIYALYDSVELAKHAQAYAQMVWLRSANSRGIFDWICQLIHRLLTPAGLPSNPHQLAVSKTPVTRKHYMKLHLKYLGSELTFDTHDRFIYREDHTVLPYASASVGLQQACIKAVHSKIHHEHSKNPSNFGDLLWRTLTHPNAAP